MKLYPNAPELLLNSIFRRILRLRTCPFMIVLLVTMLVGNSVFGQSDIAKSIDRFKTNSFDVAIFPSGHKDSTVITFFKPSIAVVREAETLLASNIKKLSERKDESMEKPIIHKNLRNYKRQYFGVVNSMGDSILVVNALWYDSAPARGWLINPIEVYGMGSKFWKAKYNLRMKQWFYFKVS